MPLDFAAALADRLDPPDPDVFGKLRYVPTPKQAEFHAATEFAVLYGGSTGGGKGGRCPDRAAPSYNPDMETKVLTPKGFKLIGDIEPGDVVCNPDGTTAQVIKITDNRPKQFYRVTLSDGSSVEADGDHLWVVTVSAQRKRRKKDIPYIPPGLRPEDEWNLRVQSRCKLVTTLQLRELAARADADKAAGHRPRYALLPMVMPLGLTGAPGRWERFSPYILGALIGDGSLSTSVQICGIDEAVFDRIRDELPEHLCLTQLPSSGTDGKVPNYSITRCSAVTDEVSASAFQAEFERLLGTPGWRSPEYANVPERPRMGRPKTALGAALDELAARADVDAGYLFSVRGGRRRPTAKFVARLDELLGAGGSLSAAHADHAGATAGDMLHRDGLAGTHSWDKFAPERIKLAPVPDRFAFIQGLMDTDGTMDTRGHVSFTTVSERLARDVQDVLRSLGYRATLTARNPTYVHNGERRQGRLAYTLYVQGRHMDRLFHLPRKRERVTQYNGGDIEPWNRVVSVEPTVVDNSRCIQVDNLNQLYVTDDYIVTHNSRALTAEAIRACVRYPGLRVGAFRRSYPELRESLLAELAKLEYARPLGATWNGTEHELRFSNGSLIMFRYAETLADATRRQGGEYQLLVLDELTLFGPDVVTFLESRVRSGRADIPVLGIRASANPGGAGHGEVKERYIVPTAYGENVVIDERGRTVRFIPSRLSDNPHMNPEHAADLQALSGEMRKAFLDGNWNVFAGQMYPELNRDRHVVQPFALPETWQRFCGIDWGYYPSFWAVVWAAIDEDGRAWVYREAYEQMVLESDQARQILAAEMPGEHIAVRWADDAMWAARGEAKPISQVYADNGVHLTPASKGSRVTGWQRVRSYLAEMPACPHHRSLGWDTCPRLHIFSGCENLFRHLADLSHASRGDPEDAGPSKHDHLPDAIRYLLINLGGGPDYPILGDVPASASNGARNVYGAEVLQPMGTWAVRADSEDAGWQGGRDDEVNRTGQKSPFG
jgi:hypothetical protein